MLPFVAQVAVLLGLRPVGASPQIPVIEGQLQSRLALRQISRGRLPVGARAANDGFHNLTDSQAESPVKHIPPEDFGHTECRTQDIEVLHSSHSAPS